MYWAKAGNTAIHVINCTGTSHISGKFPCELNFGQKPYINEVVIHVPYPRKFDAKSIERIVIGYSDIKFICSNNAK